MHGVKIGDTVLRNGKPVRVIMASPWDIIVGDPDEQGTWKTSQYAELEMVGRNNVEFR